MNRKALFDTNILVYAHNDTDPRQKKAQNVILAAMKKEIGYVAYQNLLEFYNVITDSRKVPNPITAEQAVQVITQYQKSPMHVIYPDEKAYLYTFELVCRYKLSGRQRIIDALLVAVMKQHQIEVIYTLNTTDFDWCRVIDIINPFDK